MQTETDSYYSISCYDLEMMALKHFLVPHSIYNYIKQLEGYINNPKTSGLKDFYSFRFNKEI